MLIGLSFTLGKFSFMILLKIVSGPYIWESSFSIPIILKFCLFTMSLISWMFCFRNFLDLRFSLTNVLISSIVFSTPKIPPSLYFVGDTYLCSSYFLPYVLPLQDFFSLIFFLVFLFTSLYFKLFC